MVCEAITKVHELLSICQLPLIRLRGAPASKFAQVVIEAASPSHAVAGFEVRVVIGRCDRDVEAAPRARHGGIDDQRAGAGSIERRHRAYVASRLHRGRHLKSFCPSAGEQVAAP